MKNLLIILITLFSVNLSGQECYDISKGAFGDKEKLEYKVFYNWKDVWLKAGKVTFDVDESTLGKEDVFHISARGKTATFYNWFFKVDDKYETFVDTKNYLPRKFKRDVKEGSFKLYREYSFNRNSNSLFSKTIENSGRVLEKDYSFNDCTHDMLSSIYIMRNLDFKQVRLNEEKPIEVFFDNKLYDLSMVYRGKAIVNTKFGDIQCLKVEPKIISGRVFPEGKTPIVYISDDENKIPVLIESPLSVGSVKIILDDFAHLQNEMTSIQ